MSTVTVEIDMRGMTREELAAFAAIPGESSVVRWIAPTIKRPEGSLIRQETRGFIQVDSVFWQNVIEQLKKDVSVLDDGSIESKPKYFEEVFILIREVQ